MEGGEGKGGGKDILLEFVGAEGSAEHPITRLLARCAYAETIERDAAIVGIGQRRAADDRPLGHAERVAGGREHRILRERGAGVVRDVARHLERAADALLIIGVPARFGPEPVDAAVRATDGALQLSPRGVPDWTLKRWNHRSL